MQIVIQIDNSQVAEVLDRSIRGIIKLHMRI